MTTAGEGQLPFSAAGWSMIGVCKYSQALTPTFGSDGFGPVDGAWLYSCEHSRTLRLGAIDQASQRSLGSTKLRATIAWPIQSVKRLASRVGDRSID